MKKLTKFFAFALAMTSIVSCGESTKNTQASLVNESEINLETHRGGAAGVKEFETMTRFALSSLTAEQIAALETITMSSKAADANADAAEAQAQRQMFMAAEKEDSNTKVNFSMSEEPVDNGMFVFSVETEDEKELTFEEYDDQTQS
jgi:hypothetical protein